MKIHTGNSVEGNNVSSHSLLGEMVLLIFATVTVVVLSYWLLGFIAEKMVEKLPLSFEEKLGNLYLNRFDKSDPNKAVQTYVESVLGKLESQIEQKHVPFKINIVCDEVTNAFAVPGGGIILYSSLLKLLKSEEELAMLLGHEIGHHLQRHHLRGLGRQLVFIAMSLALGLGDAGSVSGLVLGRTTQFAELDRSRGQEAEADDIAWGLLAKVYDDPGLGISLFDRLDSAMPKGATSLPTWMFTHPHPQERVQRLLTRLDSKNGRKSPTPLPQAIFGAMCKEL